MRNRLRRLLAEDLPPNDPGSEDAAGRLRARTLSASALVLGALSFPMVPVYLAIGSVRAALALTVIGLVAGAVWWSRRRGLPIRLATHVLALDLVFGLLFMQAHLGGAQVPGQVWLLVPALLAGVVLGTRALAVYTAIACLQVLGFAALEQAGVVFPDLLPPALHPAFAALFRIEGALVVTGLFAVSVYAERQARRAVQVQEERLRTVLESAADAIVELDADGAVALANRAAEALFGRSREDLLGRSVASLVTGLANDAAPGAIRAALLAGEGDVVRPDGGVRRVEISQSTEGAAAPGRVTAILRDVSERRRAELAWRASEARFRAMIDASPLGVFMTDTAGVETYVNAEYARIAGQRAEEALGDGWARALHPEDRDRVLAEWAETVASGRTGCTTFRMVRPEGTTVWVSVRSALVQDDGRTLGFIGTVEDVSERRAAEHRLREARDAALAATRAKSEFLATISHEIRTPMNGILGAATLLLDSEIGDEQREYAGIVKRSAESLLGLLNEILDVSKIEAGRLQLERIGFDLPRTVEGVMEMLLPSALEKRLSLVGHVAADVPPRLVGDAARLRQVLVNLVGNAIKFTERGDVRLDVRCEEQDDDAATLHVSVSDTGIGVPVEVLPRLFERFRQGDASTTRRFGGTGLGLAISKQLVELMGGEIGVTSEEGKGSRFWFRVRLPLDRRKEERTPDVGRRSDDRSLEGVRVLLVEDNAVNRKLAMRFLERLGCRVTVAADGGEAVASVARERFDAVLMDCHMPVLDGYDATREIRRREQGRERIPIVALTASAMPGDRDACLEAGMDDFLAKPLDAARLATVLRRWAGRSR